jgi:hypothetical protein
VFAIPEVFAVLGLEEKSCVHLTTKLSRERRLDRVVGLTVFVGSNDLLAGFSSLITFKYD